MKHLALLSLVILCTSCASAVQEVPLPPKPFVLKGFSLVPPDEKGWYVDTKPSPDRLLLVKRNHDKDPYENYAIEAYALNVSIFKSNELFLQAVKEGKAIISDPRYKILKHDRNPYMQRGQYCALSHVVAEDHGRVPSFGFGIHRRLGHMIFEEIGLTCRHPQKNNVALDLAFSLRYYPGEREPLFSERAMKVVDSVKFTDL